MIWSFLKCVTLLELHWAAWIALRCMSGIDTWFAWVTQVRWVILSCVSSVAFSCVDSISVMQTPVSRVTVVTLHQRAVSEKQNLRCEPVIVRGIVKNSGRGLQTSSSDKSKQWLFLNQVHQAGGVCRMVCCISGASLSFEQTGATSICIHTLPHAYIYQAHPLSFIIKKPEYNYFVTRCNCFCICI